MLVICELIMDVLVVGALDVGALGNGVSAPGVVYLCTICFFLYEYPFSFPVHLCDLTSQKACKLVDSVVKKKFGQLLYNALAHEILLTDLLVVRKDRLQRLITFQSLVIVLPYLAIAVNLDFHGPGHRNDGKESNSFQEFLGVLILLEFWPLHLSLHSTANSSTYCSAVSGYS